MSVKRMTAWIAMPVEIHADLDRDLRAFEVRSLIDEVARQIRANSNAPQWLPVRNLTIDGIFVSAGENLADSPGHIVRGYPLSGHSDD